MRGPAEATAIAMVKRALVLFFLASAAVFVAGAGAASAQSPLWYPIANITAHTTVEDVDPGSAWTLFSVGRSPTGQARSWDLETGSSSVLDVNSNGGPAIEAVGENLVAFVRQTGVGDYIVSVVNTSTGWVLLNLSTPSGALITGLAWINETTLLVGQASCNITSFSILGAPIKTYLQGGDGGCQFIEVSPDRKLVAAGTSGGTMKIWRIADGAEVFNASDSFRNFLDGVFPPDLSIFVFVDSQRYVRWVDLSTFTEFRAVQIATEPISLSYLPSESLLLMGDNFAPYLRAAHAGNGTLAWTDDRIVYKVSRVRVAQNGEWFVTASEASGAMSIWAQRSEPWNPPPPPPEPTPVVSISFPVQDGAYTNLLNVSGFAQPAGAARYVMVSIDNGTTWVASGTDTWFLPVDLRSLSIGYHEVAAWALGASKVGPTSRVGFFSIIQGEPGPGPIEISLVAPLNGSTVIQVGAVAGIIANATNQTTVFVQVATRSWVAARLSGIQWYANLSPAYDASGVAYIVISAFDRDGRTAWAEFSVNISGGGTNVSDLEVMIRDPADGAIVDGEFVVNGDVVNGTGPVLTHVSLNGSSQGAYVLGRNWTVTLSTEGAAAGTHFLWVESIDAEGRVAFAGRRIVVNRSVGGPGISILFPANDTTVDRAFVLVGVCSNCSVGQRLLVYLGPTKVADIAADEYWYANVTGLAGGALIVRVELRDGQAVLASQEVSVRARPEQAVVQPTDFSTILLVVVALAVAIVAAAAIRRSGRTPANEETEREELVVPPRGPRSRNRAPRRGR